MARVAALRGMHGLMTAQCIASDVINRESPKYARPEDRPPASMALSGLNFFVCAAITSEADKLDYAPHSRNTFISKFLKVGKVPLALFLTFLTMTAARASTVTSATLTITNQDLSLDSRSGFNYDLGPLKEFTKFGCPHHPSFYKPIYILSIEVTSILG